MAKKSGKLTLVLAELVVILAVALSTAAPGLAAAVVDSHPSAQWETSTYLAEPCSGGCCGGGG